MTQPPAWHYTEADRLMAELKEIAPPFVATHLRRAEIHALLAQCPEYYGDQDDPDDWAIHLGPNGYINAPGVETRTATNDRL